MASEPLDLDAIEVLAPLANAAAVRACSDRAHMSIPVRDDDDDMVLLRAIACLPRLVARVREQEQEIAELRKRPTLEEVPARLARLREEEPSNEDFGRYVGQEITDLYAERAK